MSLINYCVNNNHFNNVYVALHESWKTGAKLEFHCDDLVFDQYDWSKEPEHSLELLMDTHANHLRNKYQRIVLLWSGGTDSHTIYNVFKRNRIHVDEIIIKASAYSAGFPEINHEWIMMNHWDPTTIITRYDDHDTALRARDVANEDWIWRDKGDLLKYGMTSVGDGVKFLCEKNHAGFTWIAVAGYEKPRLVYRNGHWYHRQLDMVLRTTMGHDHIEHFFLEPMIAIKQSHMVKHAVKKLITQKLLPLHDNDWAEAKWPPTPEGYREWSRCCGRHDEATLGVSYIQKQYNDALDKTEIDPVGGWRQLGSTHDARLTADLAAGNTTAINYVKGMHNLYAETGFRQHLLHNNWFKNKDTNITNLKFTWSKEYDIGS